MAGKYKIVMVRHGESEWNQKNLFCGWYDANLSDKGMCMQFFFYFFIDSVLLCGVWKKKCNVMTLSLHNSVDRVIKIVNISIFFTSIANFFFIYNNSI